MPLLRFIKAGSGSICQRTLAIWHERGGFLGPERIYWVCISVSGAQQCTYLAAPTCWDFMDQSLETSELMMINTALRERGSIGYIHSFKGHMGGGCHSTVHRILAQHAWRPGFNSRHKPIKLKGGILRSNLLHSFANSISIQQACAMVPLAGRALGAHYTAQRWQGSFLSSCCAVYTLACWFALFQSPAWLHLRPKGVLLSEELQFARDGRKASWDRIRTQKDWGLYHPQALCGFSLQWFLDIRCFFG